MKELNVYQKLLETQKEIVAPREISGRFGKARSAEKILEAVKPVCQKHELLLFTTDEVCEVGGRNYVMTTAKVINANKPEESIEACASAWENEVSASLDTSQVSGKTSSYAKKYALQNLFAIDDTKDADVDPKTVKEVKVLNATPKQIGTILSLVKGEDSTKEEALELANEKAGKDVTTLTLKEASDLIKELKS